MKLINLGGATAILENNGKRMLFDPWLDDGIFHGSWYHWPPVNPEVGEIGNLGRFDYIYISHIHEDHCSAGTIKHLNQDAEIIIMDRQPNFVANFLKSHGFNFSKVHLIPPRKGMWIAEDLFVDMIEADPENEMAYIIDSSIVIQWGGQTIFNANDCQPHPSGIDYLCSTYPDLDLALLPYSGGSGYPSCYLNLSEDEKLREKKRILASRVSGFISNAKRIPSKYVMPFADQYVVAGSRTHLNRLVSHGPNPGIVCEAAIDAGLRDRLLLLNSGQEFDLKTGIKNPSDEYKAYSEDDRERYIAESLRDKLYDHEKLTFSPSVPVERLVVYARERLWGIQNKRKTFPNLRFVLDFSESRRKFEIDLTKSEVQEVAYQHTVEEPYLRIVGTDTLMAMLLIGHVSWNIADAALFLDYERRPNIYDPSIYVLLNFLRI